MKRLLLSAALGLFLASPAMADTCDIKGWFMAGSNPEDYACGTEVVAGASGKAAFIKAKGANPSGFGTLLQQIAPDQYRGKRLRLNAKFKTVDAGRAQLWMRMDGPNQRSIRFYNMDDRPVTGTTPWKYYSVVLDVPNETTGIFFGFFLNGKGEVWASDFSLTVVGKEVPESAMPPARPFPKAPVNLNFEQ